MRELIRRCRAFWLRVWPSVRSGVDDAPLPASPAAPPRGRRRLLVVSAEGVRRGPFVAGVLQRQLGDDRWQVVAVGTAAKQGRAVSEPMRAAAAEYGLDLSAHRARRVTAELVGSSELVIAMCQQQVDLLLQMEPGARRRVRLLEGVHPLVRAPEGADDACALTGREDLRDAHAPVDEIARHRDCCRQLADAAGKLSRFIERREASRRPTDRRSPLSTTPLRPIRAG